MAPRFGPGADSMVADSTVVEAMPLAAVDSMAVAFTAEVGSTVVEVTVEAMGTANPKSENTDQPLRKRGLFVQ